MTSIKHLVRILVTTGAACIPFGVGAQNVTPPRPVMPNSSEFRPVTRENANVPLLQRRISLDLRRVSLQVALREIARRADDQIMYDATVSSIPKEITLTAPQTTIGEALRAILDGTPVEIFVSASGRLILLKRVALNQPTQQTGTATGRVTDKETSLPVAGVRVTVVGTSLSAVTGDDGRYTIRNVPVGPRRLRITRIGYQPVELSVTVGEGTTVTQDLTFARIPTRLDQVVATATGDRRRVELGNSIVSIQADSIVQVAPINTVSDLINARAPGVQVLYPTGLTGAGARIRIRGINSIEGNNDPVVILDGVRISAGAGDANRAGGLDFTPTPSRLDDLDPESIESIDILKGPSATTLYGTDAANGVIVIRTKRGRAGPTVWSVSADRGLVMMPTRFIESYRSWGRQANNSQEPRCAVLDQVAGRCTIDSLTSFNPLNHPETSPFRTGVESLYGMQVSGGVERLRYFLSATLKDETGTVQMPRSEIERLTRERNGDPIPDWQRHPNALKKLSFTGNISAILGPSADVSVMAAYYHDSHRGPSIGPNSFMASAEQSRGYRDARDGWGGASPGELFSQRATQDLDRVATSVAANWRPAGWLSSRANVGLDFTNRVDEALLRPGEGGQGAGLGAGGVSAGFDQGMRSTSRSSAFVYSADLGATATLNLPRGIISRTSVGTQYTRRKDAGISGAAAGLALGNETLNEAIVSVVSESREDAITVGAYLEQTTSFKDRFFFTGPSARFDAGSAFGKDAKVALYPKANLSWLVSQEPFFRRVRGITNLRVRTAFGHSGVQPVGTAALRLYTPGQGFVAGRVVGTADLQRLGNTELKPERSAEFEGGLDLGFLDDRITLEGTLYRKTTEDAIVTRELPPSLGVFSRPENIGTVKNAGIEGSVNAQVLRGRFLSWSFTLGASSNSNKLVTLGPNVKRYPVSANAHFVPGYPLYGRWARPILGYQDVNGNGVIEPSEVQIGDSLVYLGESNPKSQIALNNTIGLFGDRLRVTTQFDYRGGATQLNQALFRKCASLRSCQAVTDPNAPASLQAMWAASQAPGGASTLAGFYQRASFLRFRELAVTYHAHDALARFLRTRTANLTVSGRNLGIWTRYNGADPEVTGTYRGKDLSEDFGTVPQAQYWRLRINLGY